MLMPVMNADSSEAKNKQAAATSLASQRRPRGTFERNFSRFSRVNGKPVKDSNLHNLSGTIAILASLTDPTYSPVPPSSGQTELTRILCGPNSAARPFVACER